MQGSFIVVLVTAVIVAIFAVFNAEPVTVNLLFARFELSQAVVILVSAVLGALSMFVMNFFQSMKLNRQIKQLSKKLIDAEAKNDELNKQNEALAKSDTVADIDLGDVLASDVVDEEAIGNFYENK